MKIPFISIILPVRNEEKFIERCLKSIVKQDYPKNKFEILVIDGMSEDKTRKIVKNLQENNKNIMLFNNSKKTVPYALNIGIKKARGEVIIRVDGHSEIAKDYFRKCIYYLDKTDADCVGGPIKTIGESATGKAIAKIMSSSIGGSYFRFLKKKRYVDTLAFGAYKKEVFEKIGLFDINQKRSQDSEFNFRLRENNGRIFMSPDIKSNYYCRNSFAKLFKQYLDYGIYKTRVYRKHPKFLKIKNLCPLLLVLSPLTLFFSKFLFLFILIAYAAFLLSYSSIISSGLKEFFIIVPALVIMHISYGLGYLIGIFNFLIRRK